VAEDAPYENLPVLSKEDLPPDPANFLGTERGQNIVLDFFMKFQASPTSTPASRRLAGQFA
jgi:hypothetical protein